MQRQSGVVLGFLPAWGIVYQPFAAMLFLTAAIAENKRIPFDLPEAESELIAGYYTEYSAMKMGLFMFAEFIEIAIIGALFTTLFLGGYNLPYMTDAGFALPGGHDDRARPRRGRRDPARHVPGQGAADVQLPDPGPLVAAALPLRPAADASRGSSCCRWRSSTSTVTAVAAAGRCSEAARDASRYVRKRYWNEPTMAWWERAYLLEILRGLVDHRRRVPAQHVALDDAAARAR